MNTKNVTKTEHMQKSYVLPYSINIEVLANFDDTSDHANFKSVEKNDEFETQAKKNYKKYISSAFHLATNDA